MSGSAYPVIAREGWPFLLGVTAMTLAGVKLVGPLVLIPSIPLLAFLVLLFRDPLRDVPSSPLAVVSPVDGTIIEVAPTDKAVLEGEAMRVRVRVNNFGAYTARSPIEGKVLNLRDNVDGGSRLLGVSGLWVRNEQKDDVVLLFQGPKALGKPVSFVRYGERIGQGQRCAFTRLARIAEIYMPLNCRVSVKSGDVVRAGSSILASLVHR